MTGARLLTIAALAVLASCVAELGDAGTGPASSADGAAGSPTVDAQPGLPSVDGASGPDTGSRGSGGSGGPGAGLHAETFARGGYVLRVPGEPGPRPLVILLHGAGDTGSNFMAFCDRPEVFGGRGLLIAAPDDNTNTSALALVEHLVARHDVDLARIYAFGHSQGGGYVGLILGDGAAASTFAGLVVNSMGKTATPPVAGPSSPAVALCGDPADPNISVGGGLAAFAAELEGKGYQTLFVTHAKGHTIPVPEIGPVIDWLLARAKP